MIPHHHYSCSIERSIREAYRFAPGQFNMLWAFGVGEAPISLAGEHDGLLVHTVRAVGAVTRALCASESGDQIGLRGPFGAGWPLDRAVGRDVLVVEDLRPVRTLNANYTPDVGTFGNGVVSIGGVSGGTE